MLSCSGDDFTIPHDSDLVGNDVLTVVGGHLYVHSSPVTFKLRGHVRVSITIPEMAYLTFVGVYCPGELVDSAVSFGKSLVGEGCASSHH